MIYVDNFNCEQLFQIIFQHQLLSTVHQLCTTNTKFTLYILAINNSQQCNATSSF